MHDLQVIDLGTESIESCKISLCQILCPPRSEVTPNYRFTEGSALSQERKILKYLNSLKEGFKVVVFPEFSIPENTVLELRNIAKDKGVYIIGGLEYDHLLRNRCIVVTPGGKCYKSTKLTPSKYDHPKMRSVDYIDCFINSGFGDFAVLICYDYTSQGLLQELWGKIDILFVVANNPDVKTFSQKATSDCFASYCFIVICNNAEYGGSGIYGPLGGEGIKEKRILEVQKGVRCENIEFDVSKLRRSIEEKTGLTLEDGSKFKAVPANLERVKLSAYRPQLEYTLLDWPEPFDQDCVIINGSAEGRAIYHLTVRKDTLEKIRRIDKDFFEKLEPYLPYPPEEKYYMAYSSSSVFLPQLTARLLSSPRGGKVPQAYKDNWVMEGERVHPILRKHNIISISSSDVNIISEKINEELKKDGHVYFPQKRRPYTIFDEFINRNLERGEATDKAGIIAMTRNPFNPDKLALLCAGIRGIGTAGAIKLLAENNGEAFRGHRYGLTVFAISLETPEGFSKGPVKKVLKISDPKLFEHLDML